jgi:PGF-pre-PGF domain-containing protein
MERFKLLFLAAFAATALFFVTSASAIPIFTNNVTYAGNVSADNAATFNATQNISFTVTITDSVNGGLNGQANITNVTFQLGRPDNTMINFTVNFTSAGVSVPAVQNSSATVFFINFTQSMFGQAGTYNYTWFAKNSTGANFGPTNSNSTNVTSFVLSKATLKDFIDARVDSGTYNTSAAAQVYPLDFNNVSTRFNTTFASDIIFDLYINDANATVQNNTYVNRTAGNYTVLFGTSNATASNYTTGNTSAITFNISKGAISVSLFLNGSTSATEYNKTTDTANITATINVTQALQDFNALNFTVWVNFTNAFLIRNSTSSVVVITNLSSTSGIAVNNYSVIANVSENANYTSASTELRFGVVDRIVPTGSSFTKTKSGDFTVGGPISNSDFSCTASDNSDLTFTITGLSTSSQGKKTANCLIEDEGNNTISLNLDYNIVATGSSSSSSGGGATTGTTPADANKVSITSITANEAKTVDISDSAVKKVSITTSSAVSSAEIDIDDLTSKPSQVTEPAGTAFSYMNIEQTGLPTSVIVTATLRFEVNKSWISSNNIDQNKVYLSRFVNGSWTRLSTVRIGELSSTVVYEAETPGFSYFVIEGDTVSTQPEGTGTTGEQETVGEAGQPSQTGGILTAVGIIVVVFAVGYVLYRQRKHLFAKKKRKFWKSY